MNGQQYQELFDALLGFRDATEMGFANVYREFEIRDERWERRFTALENRVEEGFRAVNNQLCELTATVSGIAARLSL